ncbi:MAG: tripartite tricarboxylate transporter substrate binding protein [Hyphomicrobiales bacterium]|nr:tripartite tricarboxylate transporter substrate binding protein [Hyphomicrobiales bacterium]
MRRLIQLSASMALGVFAATGAVAETFPSKPIELIVPYSPGGGSDVSARVFAECLSGHLPEKVVIKNITGGAGVVAEDTVRKERPTGYRLLWQHQSLHALSARGVSEHTPEDFEIVAQAAAGYWGIFAGPKVPFEDVESLKQHIQKNPGDLRVGAALGGLSHFASLLFMDAAGMDISKVQIIGLSGGKNRIVAILQGNLHLATLSIAAAQPYVKSGKMKAIGILAPDRVAALPDHKTAKEQGVDFSYAVNWITWAPKGTPKDRLDVLRKAWKSASAETKCKESFEKKVMSPLFRAHDEVATYNKTELEAYKALIKKFEIK